MYSGRLSLIHLADTSLAYALYALYALYGTSLAYAYRETP